MRGKVNFKELYPLFKKLDELYLFHAPVVEKAAVVYQILVMLKKQSEASGRSPIIMKVISAVSTDERIVVSSIENIYSDEISNVLSTHGFTKQINLSVEQVKLDNALVPGIENTFTINVKNKGLIKSEGFFPIYSLI